MKIFKGLLIAIIGIFLLFLIVTVFLPSRYFVERKIEIQAPASVVYFLLDDLRNWKYWDTWWKLDTNQIRTYSGPLFGLNSKFSWTSKNKDVGSGEIQIIDEKPFEYIKFFVRFGTEMESFSKFRLMQLGDKILLSWNIEGELKFLAKWFRFFLDAAIGKDYEQGLNNVKKLAEEIQKNRLLFFRDTFPETNIIFISDSTSMDPQEINKKYSSSFEELFRFASQNKLKQIGAPLDITRSYSEKSFSFDLCLPVENVDNIKPEKRINLGKIPKLYVLRSVYLGPYDNFPEIYNKIHKYLEQHQLAPKWNFFEMYYTDPMNVNPEENVTIIYCPI